ncbi:unnamed protein product [Ilex paraguariensis]|uniref:Uncharacterized protein n=1 Tax=Ilex paraguariensis TaxID=185542 RepID=A0ABC8RIR8_9AQUA
MVQQMIDSKFSEYGLTNTEPGLPNHDKQLSVPVVAKKIALRDLQNENTILVPPKSAVITLFPKESGPTSDAGKISGTKRPTPECLMNPSHQKCPTNNTSNGHLVYVRRKAEAELGKSSASDITRSNVDYSQLRKLGDQDKATEQKLGMTDSKMCVPEVAPLPRASPVCFSSLKPSIPLSLGKSDNMLTPADSKYLHVSCAKSSTGNLKRIDIQHLEERYCQLQNLLKNLDQSNLDGYIQMLRSLSSVELSKHAVELEKRSIQLSLEEAKEMQRVQILDVLGKYPKNSRGLSTQQDQSEK